MQQRCAIKDNCLFTLYIFILGLYTEYHKQVWLDILEKQRECHLILRERLHIVEVHVLFIT